MCLQVLLVTVVLFPPQKSPTEKPAVRNTTTIYVVPVDVGLQLEELLKKCDPSSQITATTSVIRQDGKVLLSVKVTCPIHAQVTFARFIDFFRGPDDPRRRPEDARIVPDKHPTDILNEVHEEMKRRLSR